MCSWRRERVIMKKLLRSAASFCLCITLILISKITSYADAVLEPEEQFVRDKNAIIQGAILSVVPIIISVILIMLFWRKNRKTDPQANNSTAGANPAADRDNDINNE